MMAPSTSQCTITLLTSPVAAGFPSPAQDEMTEQLDLKNLLIKHPEATFFWRVAGCSMEGLGIHDGDLLVVDRSIIPHHGHIVVAVLDGGFVVKQIVHRQKSIILRSAHPDYPDIFVAEGQEWVIWGVVTWSVHRVAGKTLR